MTRATTQMRALKAAQLAFSAIQDSRLQATRQPVLAPAHVSPLLVLVLSPNAPMLCCIAVSHLHMGRRALNWCCV